MAITKAGVVEAVLSGIARGNTKYEKMTGGSWITDSGAEGFMAANVAEALTKVLGSGESLLIEAPFDQIQEWSGAARPRGRPREVLRGNRRADIALFNRQGRSKCVIEVKRSWNRSTCRHDIRRLLALLHACAGERNGSLKFGMLGLLIVEYDTTPHLVREKIRKKVKRIKRVVRELPGIGQANVQFSLGSIEPYPKKYGFGEEWGAAGFCILLSLRRNRGVF